MKFPGKIAGLLLLLPLPGLAQTTGGVFSPDVREGHRSFQYRAAYDPDDDRLAQRIHYQQSLNGDFMLRGIVQTRETADSKFDFDFVQAELFWDLYEGRNGYRNGFRFDARIRGNGRPGWLGLNWMNLWTMKNGYSARFIVLSGVNIGAGTGAGDGIGIGTRANFTRRMSSGLNMGLEMFSSYGSTEDFADFDEQFHQLGPVISRQLGNGWSVLGSLLFGITEATPDRNLRIWAGKSF